MLRRWDSQGASGMSTLSVKARNQMVSILAPPNSPKLRIALYSHDTMGLGHKRRNLLIAQTIAQSPLPTSILLITGMGEASNFDIPYGVDYLALPALHKQVDGKYQSRRLDVSLQEIIALRSRTIKAALEAFAPDVFIVDNVPRGAVGELNLALEHLQQQQTRCVLGLRDVLDAPAVVEREWQRADNVAAIRNYYDAVWVYGDPKVYNPVRAYNFPPDIAAKVRFTGYFDQRQRLNYTNFEIELPPGRLALCLVGGGQDGADLAQVFAQAQLPPDTNGVILTGPFMAAQVRQKLHQQAAVNPRLRVLEFVKEPTQLLRQADCVVAMGGYNTTCELLSFGKRSLIVPRVKPRTEQLIRATRLQELGLIDMLHPNCVNAEVLTAWLAKRTQAPANVHSKIDLHGLQRLPYLLQEIAPIPVSLRNQAS